MIVARCIVIAVAVILGFSRASEAEEAIDLPSRPGVTQPILYEAVPAPVASVILFPGGDGVVAQVRNNFLLRVRGRFVAAGMSVAVADAPSDHRGGMDTSFRASGLHAQDIGAIAAFLKAKAPAPVWLVGTSRGSISAANAAARLGPGQVAGVVLTSSVWSGGMSAVSVAAIAVPVLVVHNRDDACRESPFPGAEQAMPQLTGSPAKELVAVSGGLSRSQPCQAMSPHGYNGIEDQVVPPIIDWIKAHPPAANG